MRRAIQIIDEIIMEYEWETHQKRLGDTRLKKVLGGITALRIAKERIEREIPLTNE